MEKIMDAIRAIRNRRAEMNIPPSKKSKVYVETVFSDVFAVGSEFIKRLAYASDVEIADAFGDLGNTVDHCYQRRQRFIFLWAIWWTLRRRPSACKRNWLLPRKSWPLSTRSWTTRDL